MRLKSSLPIVDVSAKQQDGPRAAGSAAGASRRAILRLAAASAAGSALAQAHPQAAQAADRYDPDGPLTRYPEADVVALDKRFRYKLGNTPILRLYRGTLWAEGPAWNGVGRYLVWSDIPRNEILRWTEEEERVSRRFRAPSFNANGNTFDHQGRQISFCHQTRNVVRYESDGSVTVMADRTADGKGLNAPNDGAVAPDGALYFTDPGYGALMNYEGNRVAESAQSVAPFQKEAVYRCETPGKIEKVADEPFKPNGLCFSPDYKHCYISDTGGSHYPEAKSVIWVYDHDGKALRNGRVFASMALGDKHGGADGIRCDEQGNLWAAMG